MAEGAELWQPSWSCPREGYFFPPTLFTNVAPASTIAQVEIFGPVLVTMTFRSPAEAVALANNTAYGLAASVWSENINLALDVARKIKAGTVWINSTNLFDAASGFGGYRESGFGREGGKEGLYEYLQHVRATEQEPDRQWWCSRAPACHRQCGCGCNRKRANGRAGRSRSLCRRRICQPSIARQNCSSAASRCDLTRAIACAIYAPNGRPLRRSW